MNEGTKLNKYLQPNNAPITAIRGTTGYEFDTNSDRGMVKAIHLHDFSFNKGSGGTISLGGLNNGNGLMQVLSSSGGTVVTANNAGITINNGNIVIKNSSGNTILDNLGIVSQYAFVADSYIDYTEYNTASTTFVDVGTDSLDFIIERDNTAVLVYLSAQGYSNTDFVDVQIYDSLLASELIASTFSGILYTEVDWDSETGLVNSVGYYVFDEAVSNVGIFYLNEGTHTIKLQYKNSSAGTAKIFTHSIGYIVLGN